MDHFQQFPSSYSGLLEQRPNTFSSLSALVVSFIMSSIMTVTATNWDLLHVEKYTGRQEEGTCLDEGTHMDMGNLGRPGSSALNTKAASFIIVGRTSSELFPDHNHQTPHHHLPHHCLYVSLEARTLSSSSYSTPATNRCDLSPGV